MQFLCASTSPSSRVKNNTMFHIHGFSWPYAASHLGQGDVPPSHLRVKPRRHQPIDLSTSSSLLCQVIVSVTPRPKRLFALHLTCAFLRRIFCASDRSESRQTGAARQRWGCSKRLREPPQRSAALLRNKPFLAQQALTDPLSHRRAERISQEKLHREGRGARRGDSYATRSGFPAACCRCSLHKVGH